MKKKILFRSLLSAPIGVTVSLVITIVFSLCMGQGEYFPATPSLIDWCGNGITAVIVQTAGALFLGAVCGGASVIFEIEKWSLLKQTLIHFSVFSVSFVPISYVLNWMPHSLYGALSYVASFIIMYVFIWMSIYFRIKAKIKKMNRQLQQMRQEEEKEN